MRWLAMGGVAAVLMSFVLVEAWGSHAELTPERAAKRARIVAEVIADRSRLPIRAIVRASSCRRVGSTGHRRDCTARFVQDGRLVCTARVRVRFRNSSSTGTIGYADRLSC